uniref:Uncharacterized protein n=1 Tax=Terrapene triunguis TaxID=2587831 RepID=A0A674II54_9SAUR
CDFFLLTGEVGGSITIKCPVKDISSRKFWCRELETGVCGTIISTSPYIKGRELALTGPHLSLRVGEISQVHTNEVMHVGIVCHSCLGCSCSVAFRAPFTSTGFTNV